MTMSPKLETIYHRINHIRKDKFSLSICTCFQRSESITTSESVDCITGSQHVNDDGNYQTHCDPNGGVDGFIPVGDEDGSGTQFSR